MVVHQQSQSSDDIESSKSTESSPSKQSIHLYPNLSDKNSINSPKNPLATMLPIQPEHFPFTNEQFSAQFQAMCLAQLASAYQQNPLLSQSFLPLFGAVAASAAVAAASVDPYKTDIVPNQFSGTANFDFIASQVAAAAATAGANASASNAQQFNQTTVKKSRQIRKSINTNDTKVTDNSNRTASSGYKSYKDEPIPQGYLKFRFNEDCNFPNCGYSNLQSHFHCCRTDCYYSFCDKTRFVQHTARHERLDKLMGEDFKQYRANMHCGYDNCVYKCNLGKKMFEHYSRFNDEIYFSGFFFDLNLLFFHFSGSNNKSSHFHCLKCDFICSDTNKVVAHRRQHSKMEYISAAGFRKIANNERCFIATNEKSNNEDTQENIDDNDNNDLKENDDIEDDSIECAYSMKQTHYHCLICDACVLNRAQLGSHKHK